MVKRFGIRNFIDPEKDKIDKLKEKEEQERMAEELGDLYKPGNRWKTNRDIEEEKEREETLKMEKLDKTYKDYVRKLKSTEQQLDADEHRKVSEEKAALHIQ